MAGDLDNAIRTNAEGPRRASADGVSAEQHSLSDQTAADKHLAGKAAVAGKGLGIKLVKLSPGGTA